MNQILSQDEIDALLGGLDEIQEPAAEQPVQQVRDDSGVVPYDFTNSIKMSRVKYPSLDVVNDHFNRGLRSTLSSVLRMVVDSSLMPLEIIAFKDFLKRVPVPSNIHILKMEPLSGNFMMVLDPLLVFSIVEIFLGSTAIGQARIEGREFTSIEQRLIRKIVDSLLIDLNKAWNSVHQVKIKYVRSEINPQFAKIVQDDDAVIVNKIQVDLEEISGAITLCTPLNMLQPIKSKLQGQIQKDEADDPAWKIGLISNLRQTPVEIRIPLGKAMLTGKELMDLAVGDIIQLDTTIDSVLPVLVQNQLKFLASPGIFKGQRAVKIEKSINEEEVVH